MDIKERSALCTFANQRAETFFTKLKPLGYKNFDDAIDAYCADYEKRNNKEN